MDYSVHIKISDENWILERCAKEIAKRSKNVTYSTKPNAQADIQYYMNYSCFNDKVSPIEIAFFTHIEEAAGTSTAKQKFFDVANKMDYCTSQAERYAEILRERGIRDVTLTPPGVDASEFSSKLKIGVIGRTYKTGRKGEALVAKVMDIPGIEWKFTGEGWPGPALNISQDKMSDFYNSLDYVLVPALYEGGPMSVIEGLSCGIPIIASEVGWVTEFPHITFENGNSESLRKVLLRLVKEKDDLRKSVAHISWENWASIHLELFERIINENSEIIKKHRIKTNHNSINSEEKPNAVIISHGSEKIDLGGPTTRIRLIKEAAITSDIKVINLYGIEEFLSLDRHPDIAHVFNSWPVNSGLTTLRNLSLHNIPTVFSPIALSLQYLKYFDKIIPKILKRSKTEKTLQNTLQTYISKTPPWNKTSTHTINEGPKGHFDALKEMVETADHIIYLSKHEESFAKKLGCKPNNSTIIHNGIDAETMAKGDKTLFSEKYGISDFALIVGRIETRKNQAVIAAALNDLQTPLVIIGHIADPEYFKLLKKWAGPNLIHIERIEDRKLLASAYKSAAVFILVSWSEGAPLVALEAAAAGTPLILSNMSSELEYFGTYAKYLHPCDIKGIKSAVLEIIKNPETFKQRNSRSKMAMQKFDIELHTKKTLSFYKESLLKFKSKKLVNDNISLIIETAYLPRGKTHIGLTNDEKKVETELLKELLRLEKVQNIFSWETQSSDAFSSNLESQTKNNLSYLPSTKVSKISKKRKLITLVKKSIKLLPPDAVKIITKFIQKIRPTYSPEYSKNDKLQSFIPCSDINLSHNITKIDLNLFNINYAVPNKNKKISKLIMLGQSWQENDLRLRSLENFVNNNNLQFSVLIHNISFITDPISYSSKIRSVYKARLLRLLDFTDNVIVTSEMIGNQIKSFTKANGLQSNIIRIKIGSVDTEQSTSKLNSRIKLPKRYVLYISPISNKLNPTFLIEIWKDLQIEYSSQNKINDIQLLFIEKGKPNNENHSEKKFRDNLLNYNIRFLYDIDDQDLVFLYRQAMFTVYPQGGENWGLSPIRSLRNGKPCIISNNLPVSIETDCAALLKISPSDYYNWRNCIKSLLENNDMLISLSKVAADFKHPSWADTIESIIKKH